MPSAQLSFDEARSVLQAALARATDFGCADGVSIVVTDAGGAVVCMLRNDDRWFQAEIAEARAYSAAALRRDGTLTGSLLDSRAHWRTMPDHLAGWISLGPGGVLLRADGRAEYHHGENELVLGAIGVSGAADVETDEAIARAGATAARRDA